MGALAFEMLDVFRTHAQIALAGPDQDFFFFTHYGEANHELLAGLETLGGDVDQLVAFSLGQFRYILQGEGQQVAVGCRADDGLASALLDRVLYDDGHDRYRASPYGDHGLAGLDPAVQVFEFSDKAVSEGTGQDNFLPGVS